MKNYNHDLQDIIEACGFNDEEFKRLTKTFNDLIESSNSPSETIEKMEKYVSLSKNNEEQLRFLILNYTLFLMYRFEDSIENFITEPLAEIINKQCETCSKKDECKNKCEDVVKH